MVDRTIVAKKKALREGLQKNKNFVTKMATAGARVDSLGTVDECLLYLQRTPAVLEQVLYTTNRIK
jgi:hypothetical protein